MSTPAAPDPATVVMNELFPPGPMPPDAITLYDGALQAKNGFSPWKSWDVRGWLNRLVWDLLRFQTIDSGKPNSDRTVPYGLRDTVTATWYLADQNNVLLRAIATKVGLTVAPPAALVKTGAVSAAHAEAFVDAVRQHLTGQEEIYRRNGITNPTLLAQAGLVVRM